MPKKSPPKKKSSLRGKEKQGHEALKVMSKADVGEAHRKAWKKPAGTLLLREARLNAAKKAGAPGAYTTKKGGNIKNSRSKKR